MRLVCLTDRSVRYPGECWLSTTEDGFRVAVDVGSTTGGFGLTAAAHEPHVLVLTHDDLDHVGGIEDFLGVMQPKPPSVGWAAGEGSGAARDVLQIWMPFDWVRLLLVLAETRGLLAKRDYPAAGDPGADKHVDHMLEGTVDGTGRDGPGAGGRRAAKGLPESQQVIRNRQVLGANDRELSRWHERRAERRPDGEALMRPRGSTGRPEPDHVSIRGDTERLVSIVASISGLAEVEKKALADAVSDSLRRRRDAFPDLAKGRNGWTGSEDAIGKRAVGTALRTLAVIQAGLAAGVRLRFFDPDSAFAMVCAYPKAPPPWQTEGEPGRVTVINAREVGVQLPPIPGTADSRDDALALAAFLTVQNKRALATFVWPDTARRWMRERGAIIWSDTQHTIAGQLPTHLFVPWFATGLMSAPHHASTDKLHVDLWRYRPAHVRVVLSHNSHRDCDHFLSIPPSQRDCTKCASQAPEHGVGHDDLRSWGWPEVGGRCLETHV